MKNESSDPNRPAATPFSHQIENILELMESPYWHMLAPYQRQGWEEQLLELREGGAGASH